MTVRVIVASVITYLFMVIVFSGIAEEEDWPVLLTPLILILPMAVLGGIVALWIWAVQP